MKSLVLACGVAISGLIAAPAVDAAVSIDGALKPVSVQWTNGQCKNTSCSVSGSVVPGFGGMSSLSAVGDSETMDFLSFSGQGTGRVRFGIEASFSVNGEEVVGTGIGSVRMRKDKIKFARFAWDNLPATISTGGYEFSLAMQEGTRRIFGGTAPVSATLTVDSAPGVSAVPLPASGAALALGMVGFAAYRRGQKRKRA